MKTLRWLIGEWSLLLHSYRTPSVTVAAVLLLWFIIDFSLRVLISRDSSLRTFSVPAATTIARADTAEQIRQQLDLWLPTKAAEPEVVERQIKLQGVFGSGAEVTAILALSPPAGTPVERVRASVGQVIEGWTVESITRRKVMLKRGEEGRELLLFRPITE